VPLIPLGHNKTVMPGLDPGIHVFFFLMEQYPWRAFVDGRVKPGHDALFSIREQLS
jgi:hypothetical protein